MLCLENVVRKKKKLKITSILVICRVIDKPTSKRMNKYLPNLKTISQDNRYDHQIYILLKSYRQKSCVDDICLSRCFRALL